MKRPTRRSTRSPSPAPISTRACARSRTTTRTFDPKTFVDGAKMAYEMIVMAYADGDRKTLKNLLSREVYDGFVAAIAERETSVGKDPVFVRRHRQGRHRRRRDEGRRGPCHAAHRQRADLGDPRQGRRRHRRRSRDGGRGQGRLDLRPRHRARAIRTGSWSPPRPKTESRRDRRALGPLPLSPIVRQCLRRAARLGGRTTIRPLRRRFAARPHKVLVKPYRSGGARRRHRCFRRGL